MCSALQTVVNIAYYSIVIPTVIVMNKKLHQKALCNNWTSLIKKRRKHAQLHVLHVLIGTSGYCFTWRLCVFSSVQCECHLPRYCTYYLYWSIQGVPKKTEPCIEYAKYQTSVNIAQWKVHGLLHMAFCHTLSKFCLKIFISLQIIVNFRNAAENPF